MTVLSLDSSAPVCLFQVRLSVLESQRSELRNMSWLPGVSPLAFSPSFPWTEGLSGLINAQWAAGWPEAPHPRPADSGRLRSCRKTVLCRILYCPSSQGSDVRLVALRAFHFSMLGWDFGFQPKVPSLCHQEQRRFLTLLLCIRNSTSSQL